MAHMANLIITVISIALVAVAALMGAYYGGSAFMDGQVKAQANSLIAGAEQLATAYRMIAANNGGDYTLYSGNLEVAPQVFVPQYLSTIPKFDWVDVFAGIRKYPFLQIWSFENDTINENRNGGNAIVLRAVPEKVCQRINTIANVIPTETNVGTWDGMVNTAIFQNQAKPFICGQLTFTRFFVYRVY